MDIDNIIAGAFPQESATAPEAQEANTQEQSTEVNQEGQEPDNTELQEPKRFTEEEWLKKERNAVSRRDKKIGSLQAQNRELMERLSKIEQNQAQPQKQTQQANDGRPNPDNYQTYGEYVEAFTDWKTEQKLQSYNVAQQKQASEQQEAAYYQQRYADLGTQTQNFYKEVPDALSTLNEYADTIDSLPPAIVQFLLEAENAPNALYNLAKSGELDTLAEIPLARAIAKIARAEAQPITKPQTKAPAPMQVGKGNTQSKNLNNMDFYALKKELGLK